MTQPQGDAILSEYRQITAAMTQEKADSMARLHELREARNAAVCAACKALSWIEVGKQLSLSQSRIGQMIAAHRKAQP
jgi:hypothetical protein